MPKATIHEHRNPGFGEDDIRFASQLGYRATVYPVAQTALMKGRSKRELRRRIAPSRQLHAPPHKI